MVQLEVGLQYKLAGNELDLASLEQGSTRFIIPPAFHPMPQTAPGTLRPPGGRLSFGAFTVRPPIQALAAPGAVL